MKKFIKLTTFVLIVTAIYGCSKEDDNYYNYDSVNEVAIPTGVSASVNGSSVSISWNAVSDASSYNVYRSNSATGTYALLSWLSHTTDNSAVDHFPLNGDNFYKIKAFKSGRESDYSSYAHVYFSNTGGNTGGGNDNPGGGNQGGGNTPQKPSTPSGLKAYWDGPASYPYVVLSWNSVSNATSYTVYRSNSANGSYSRLGNSSYSSYSDNNVSIGKTYYYKVTASNSSGTSDYSNYTSVTLEDQRKPGPVTYGNCTATNTSITLKWSIPTDPSYGKPNKVVLRLYDPTYKTWVDAQELSGTATSVTFSFGMWIDSDGYVKCGVIPYNDYGSGGGVAKVYDAKNKKWIN